MQLFQHTNQHTKQLLNISRVERNTGQVGMLEARGRYWRVKGRLYVYVPSKVSNDSQCPLTEQKGDVIVRIEKKKVIVEKA